MSFIDDLVNLGFDFVYGLAVTNSTVRSHEETIKKLYSAEPLSVCSETTLKNRWLACRTSDVPRLYCSSLPHTKSRLYTSAISMQRAERYCRYT